MKKVLNLNVNGAEVDDARLQQSILNCQEKEIRFDRLNLSSNRLTSESVPVICDLAQYFDRSSGLQMHHPPSLSVSDNSFGNAGFLMMMERLPYTCPHLHTLEMDECEFDGSVFEHIPPLADIFPHLTHLQMRRNPLSESPHLGAKLESTQLQRLCLSGTKMKQSTLLSLVQSLPKMPALTLLELESNFIDLEAAAALASALRETPRVRNLMLSSCKMGLGVGNLGTLLASGHPLAQLDLRDNRINDVAADLLAEGLVRNPHLLVLDLAGNFIGNRGATQLAKALSLNCRLQYLMIDRNQISGPGGLAFAMMLKQNASLECLNMSHNFIGDEGGKAMARALRVNSTLSTLILENCELSHTSVWEIMQTLPESRSLTQLNMQRNEFRSPFAERAQELLTLNCSMIELHVPGFLFPVELRERNEKNQLKKNCSLYELLIEYSLFKQETTQMNIEL